MFDKTKLKLSNYQRYIMIKKVFVLFKYVHLNNSVRNNFTQKNYFVKVSFLIYI